MIIDLASRFLLAIAALLFLAAPAAAPGGEARIAPWYRNLEAAVSLRFDDAHESHVTTVIPRLNEHGFRATFLVSPGTRQYRARQDFWEQKVPGMGHRLGNHTMNHRGARTVEDADYEIGEASRTLWRAQPGESRLLVFASGGGKKLWGGKEWEQADPAYRKLVQKYHLIDLYDGNHPYLSVRSGMEEDDLCGSVDRALVRKDHQSYAFHAIGDVSFREWVRTLISGYGLTIDEETFSGFLGCLDGRRQRLWVAPLGDILKYQEEARDAVTRTTLSDRHTATVELTVQTDPALYDHPLTLILPRRQGLVVRSVRQGREQRAVYHDEAGGALVDVQPKSSMITITYGEA
jgi:peptidoglycan/xylan/chitin deacetylase (PgdA/CDA1 family)